MLILVTSYFMIAVSSFIFLRVLIISLFFKAFLYGRNFCFLQIAALCFHLGLFPSASWSSSVGLEPFPWCLMTLHSQEWDTEHWLETKAWMRPDSLELWCRYGWVIWLDVPVLLLRFHPERSSGLLHQGRFLETESGRELESSLSKTHVTFLVWVHNTDLNCAPPVQRLTFISPPPNECLVSCWAVGRAVTSSAEREGSEYPTVPQMLLIVVTPRAMVLSASPPGGLGGLCLGLLGAVRFVVFHPFSVALSPLPPTSSDCSLWLWSNLVFIWKGF